MTHAQRDTDRRELTPPEAAMMTCEVGDLDLDLDLANTLPESTENVADREETKPPAERTTSPIAVSITPPSDRGSPTVRPVRTHPMMGCALHPPANDHQPVDDPLRELRSYIGIRPADIEAVRHRQMLARDLRLRPQLYNWLVFGLIPGSPLLLSPFLEVVTITRASSQHARVSRDLVTLALGQISTAWLVYHL